MYNNKIIQNLRVLTEYFIPRRVVHREGQLESIRNNLKPLTQDRKPRNSFLFGEPGTGKTCISLYVLEELKSYAPVYSSYVNCWRYPSRFRVLYKILQDLGSVLCAHRKGTPTDELLDLVSIKLKEKPCVVIMDEVDQLEEDKVLYNLMEMESICLIFIANKETVFYNVDPRIRSRLSGTESIEFPSYTPSEIFDILKDRVEWGLVPGVVRNRQLERIALFSNGDARKAIEILRISAEIAESSDSNYIKDKHISSAMKNIRDSQNKIIEDLNIHQKLLYNIIKKRGEIRPSELYKEYCLLCKEKPLQERTIRKHLEKMNRYGIIRSVGSGRWRIYRC